jgi:hypothetical protein
MHLSLLRIALLSSPRRLFCFVLSYQRHIVYLAPIVIRVIVIFVGVYKRTAIDCFGHFARLAVLV